MATATYPVAGMTCQACVKRVQTALAPFAQAVTVSLNPPQVVLEQPTASITELKNALAGSHYSLGEIVATAVPIQLIKRTVPAAPVAAPATSSSWLVTYRPLLLVLAYILVGSIAVQLPNGQVTGMETMRYFMAGFFLVFSFFKMLDLPAFADAYAGYDLLAKRWRPWGLLYPFVELSLGLAYLTDWQPKMTNAITFVVMGFSSIGVIRAVINKQAIRCACLGSVFQLPMSTVTIVEDIAMVLMAGAMLLA